MKVARLRAPALAVALGGAAPLLSSPAAAQVCEAQRPTQPGGSQGLAYGSAEVAFFDSASGRARVHYALTGAHAPPAESTLEQGVPDAVAIAARAAEDALDEFAELGFDPPLSDRDSPCGENGGSDAVDVYVLNFAAADGQAVVDHCRPGAPRRCAGFVLVENDYRRGGYADALEGMRTVVPHELFHLVQNGYDADVERWWAEGSAQWAAKRVYPELPDLERFLPAYFDNPWRPLNVPPMGVVASFLYATAIWPVFLDERYGASIVTQVYEGFGPGSDGVLPTTDLILREHGSSLAEAFLQFAAYNAATGERAGDGGYRAAADYPLVELTPFPAAPGESLDEVASGLGAFYYSVESEAPVELSLEADSERVAALLVPLIDGQARLDDAAPLPATLEGSGIVVVAGQTLARIDAPFTLRAGAAEPAPGEGRAGAAGEASEPSSSGCSVLPGSARAPRKAGAFGAIVVSLAGLALARRARRRKDA